MVFCIILLSVDFKNYSVDFKNIVTIDRHFKIYVSELALIFERCCSPLPYVGHLTCLFVFCFFYFSLFLLKCAFQVLHGELLRAESQDRSWGTQWLSGPLRHPDWKVSGK